jgi:glycosyltransferase involved in cell wall biosynthesis
MSDRNMGKAKVLHIIDHLGVGGAQILIQSILPGLNEYFEIHLVVIGKGNDTGRIHLENVHCVRYGKWNFIGAYRYIKKYMSDNTISIVHCHLQKSICIGATLAKFSGSNVVLHEHGYVLEGNRVYLLIMRVLRSVTIKYVAVSNVVKNVLVDKLKIDSNNVWRIYNCIDYSRLKGFYNTANAIKVSLQINEDDFIIGYLGRLDKVKGVFDIVKMAIELERRECRYKCLVVGSGDLEKRMKRLVKKKGLEKKVIIPRIERNTYEYCSLFDIAVMPSYHEAFGITVLELSYMGIPLIGYDIEGLNEILNHEEDALLCPAGDTSMLATNAMRLCYDRELREKLRKNIKNIHKRYYCERSISEVAKLYKFIFSQKK